MGKEYTKEELIELAQKAKTHKEIEAVATALGIQWVKEYTVKQKKEIIITQLTSNSEEESDSAPSVEPENAPDEEEDNGDDNTDESGDKDETEPVSTQVELYRGVQVLRKGVDVRYGKTYVDFETIDGVRYSMPEDEYNADVKFKTIK